MATLYRLKVKDKHGKWGSAGDWSTRAKAKEIAEWGYVPKGTKGGFYVKYRIVPVRGGDRK